MRRALVIVVALGMGVLACGGGDDPAPGPDPTSDAPGDPAPDPDSDPGSDPDPGADPVPGPPAGGPAAPDPAPAPPPVPGPQPATGLRIERLDPASECDSVLPERAPAPVEITLAPPEGATCAGGISDGTGHVAIAALVGTGARWQVYAPDGSARSAFTAWPLLPQAAGWQGLLEEPGPLSSPVVSHRTFAPDGALRGTHRISEDPTVVHTRRWRLGPDPLGGSFALVTGLTVSGNHWSTVLPYRFDAGGDPAWDDPALLEYRSDQVLFVSAGVSNRGESLALWQQSAWTDVAWQDRGGGVVASGNLLERYATIAGPEIFPEIDLVPLLDGGVAVRSDGAFRRIYPHLALRSEPLPGWLADRAAWTYRFTRGNRGYALFPPPGADALDCSQTVELRAPSGLLCGRVVLEGDGGRCDTGAVDQGWDGTVVQQRSAGACRYRFWPALLAGP